MENGLLVRSEVDHDVGNEAEVATAQGVKEALAKDRDRVLVKVDGCVRDLQRDALLESRKSGVDGGDGHLNRVASSCHTVSLAEGSPSSEATTGESHEWNSDRRTTTHFLRGDVLWLSGARKLRAAPRRMVNRGPRDDRLSRPRCVKCLFDETHL